MGLKAKIAEKAAEHIVQAAAKEVGKHVSRRAVDHAIKVTKEKAVSTYDSVRGDWLGGKEDPTTSTEERQLYYRISTRSPVLLNERECQIVEMWANKAFTER